MGITHVIRGDDHIENTSRQVAIYDAFGWKVPQYVHLPTILGPDGERLSKRHGATTMSNFREMGYMPEALVNHLALLGWSAEDGTETFEPDQIVRAFSLERVAGNPVVCDFEKLHDLNRHYMKRAAPSRLTIRAGHDHPAPGPPGCSSRTSNRQTLRSSATASAFLRTGQTLPDPKL